MAMYEEDPNQEREDVPFPTQNGPPRFQAPQAAPQQQPHNGNGHGVTYSQPPYQTLQPRTAEQAATQRQNYPLAQSQLSQRLANVNAGVSAGSTHLAELWANQLQMFRGEFHRLTGREISDREAFDIVTTPLIMAMD